MKILVIAGNERLFRRWAEANNLGRRDCKYINHPEDLRGRREGEFVIKLGPKYYENPILNSDQGRELLANRFPQFWQQYQAGEIESLQTIQQ